MTFKKIVMFIIGIFILSGLNSILLMGDDQNEVKNNDIEEIEDIYEEVLEEDDLNMTINNYLKAQDIDTGGSYEDYYPINTHLTIENETYIYFVPFQNTKLILKLNTATGLIAETPITTEAGAITKFYHDRTNDKLYYFQNYSIVSYVDLTDDTITDLPTTLTAGGDLGIIEDIFVYDGDVWCIDTSEDDLTYYKYNTGVSTWDAMGTVAEGKTNSYNVGALGGNDNPTGICWLSPYFYVVDNNDGYIYKYNADLDTKVAEYDLTLLSKDGNTNNNPLDIATDGVVFYVTDSVDDMVYKYPTDFSSITAYYDVGSVGLGELDSPNGICFDGTYLYVSNYSNATIYKYPTDFSELTDSFDIGLLGNNDNPTGIEYENGFFYVIDYDDTMIYKYNSDFTIIIDSFDIGSLGGNTDPWGITFDSNFFYVIDDTATSVFKYFGDLITETGLILYSTVIGTNSYVIYQYVTGDCKLYVKDLTNTDAPGDGTTPGTPRATLTTGYIIPYLENQRGLAVSSDDDTLSFVLKKTSDSKTYFCTYVISTDTFTVGGEFNVSIMLNRNSNESNDLPFNTEKGFGVETGVNDLKVYQIIERGSPTNRLKNIANLTNISDFSGFVIKAITDTYMIVSDGTDSFLATFQSMSSYVYKEEVDYSLITYNHQERNQDFRGVPLAEITYNSDYLYLEKGMFIQIIGTTTILSVKTEIDIGFEGYIYNIIDKDKNSNNVKSNIKIARLVNPSYEDLHNKHPSANFTGDTDAYLDDFDDDWDYITKGTYTDGEDLGTHKLSSADKPYVDYIVEFGAIDNFIARIRPQGVLDYLDGSDDSGVDYSTAIQKYRRADRSKQYNQITVTGAYVNGALITGIAQKDASLQSTDGIQPLEISYSWVNTATLCSTAGAGILTLLKDDLIILVIGLRDATNGLIPPGELITVTFTPRSFTATDMLVTRVKYDFKTGFAQYWLSNAVRVEKEDFSYTVPAVNSEHIEQISTHITEGGGLITKTGWDINTVQDIITLSISTRTVSVTPSEAITYYIKNAEYTISTAQTVTIDDTEGLWYIYFVGTTLTASQTKWVIDAADKCLVAYVQWNATGNTAEAIGWECHGWQMDSSTHDLEHNTIGTRYETGFVLTEGTVGDAGKIALTGGTIRDEDIKIEITDGTGSDLFEQELGLASPFAAAQIPVIYKLGASAYWRGIAAGDYPYETTGGGNVAYNEYTGGAWQLTELANNKYTTYWIYTTNAITSPIYSIMGETEWNSKQDAADGATLDVLSFGDLPFEEFKVLYRLIYKSDGTLEQVDDYRSVGTPGGQYIAPPTTVSDEAYAATWDGVTSIAPSKNAVYDEIATHEALEETAHGGSLCRIYNNTYTGDNAGNGANWDAKQEIRPTELSGITPVKVEIYARAALWILYCTGSDPNNAYATYDPGDMQMLYFTFRLRIVEGGFDVADNGSNLHPNQDTHTYDYVIYY